ncbi:SprT-like domain-containing protein [Chryseosolibacter indicus]|uniref:SprT-like domain-containing protein n=1 Tax=Chryseosolibacter indicus TaxID=2782351 RepID=A0ABS5VWH1_9BACT|nr:SprT-like domain-containing protein [Chryseosolibacter indicus]MBT1705581.1 hypothetical protein [Chryseosolibacter indicus]
MKFPDLMLRSWHTRLLLVLLVLHACSEDDLQTVHKGIDNYNVERFLGLPSISPTPLKKISETISDQDAKSPFLKALIATDGYPVWEKSIVKSHGSDTSLAMVLVPLVLPDGELVNSFLACQVSKEDVIIKLYRLGDYRSYKFSNSLDNISAESLASSFMILNYAVFGVSTYEITDGRLFHHSNGKGTQRIGIRNVQEGSNERIYAMQDCWVVTHDGDQGQLVGVPPGGSNDYYYSDEVICVTTIIVQDSPPVFGSGGGSGGSGNGGNNGGSNSGGGGSGGGGGGWYTPPCTNNPPPVRNPSSSQLPPMQCPDFHPGWNPIPITPPRQGITLTPDTAPVDIIIDLDDHPCLAEIASKFAKSNSLVRFMFEQGHYSNPLDYSIHAGSLNQVTTLANTGTQGGANGYTKIVTTLNTQIIYHLSKENIMSTLIHEMVHAYRILYFGNTTEAEDHEFMADPEIINSMVNMLLDIYPTMDPSIAEALIWGGLESTNGFQALPNDKKQSILNILRDHRNAPEGSRCPS